jgi:butyrate kinase
MAFKIFVMNMGSTSTKVAYYIDRECIKKSCLHHSAKDIAGFGSIMEQYDYRKNVILKYMDENGIKLDELNCIVSRGGNTSPLNSGIYRINKRMIDEALSGLYGVHATNLGIAIAYELAGDRILPIVVDTPVTDEFQETARYSGLPEISRKSSFHVLNQKGVAKKYAASINRSREELNLIVVHMGGGISIAAHKKGRLIDANNALDGDGPFSTNRTGALPVGDLIDMCYSGKYTHSEMKDKINGNGGVVAYLGVNDMVEVERRALGGETRFAEVLEAMIYQTCKEIGAYAAVLEGKVDAILITGGIANSSNIVERIKKKIGFIAPIHVYPGEFEIDSLALGAYEALTGVSAVQIMQ